MKKYIRWIFPIVYTVGIYLLPILLALVVSAAEDAFWPMTLLGAFLTVVTVIIALIVVLVSYLKNKGEKGSYDTIYVRGALIMKTVTIPFYVFNYLLWLSLFTTVSIFPGGIFMPVLFGPVVSVITYISILPSSIYAIAGALQARRYGVIGLGSCIVLILLQFFFVLDILGIIILALKTRGAYRKLSVIPVGNEVEAI